jgi:hypothetical protein
VATRRFSHDTDWHATPKKENKEGKNKKQKRRNKKKKEQNLEDQREKIKKGKVDYQMPPMYKTLYNIQ